MRQIYPPRPSACRAGVLLLLLTAALAPAPGTAQGAIAESSLVAAVEVPVYVTDRAGQPVRGLTAGDFAVFDRGREQEITAFEVIDLERLSTPDTIVEQSRVPSTGRRHFLLLFDLSFSNPVSIVRARDAARRLVLEELAPTDLAAVATFSLDRGPRLIVTFTPDRAQLVRAIDTLGTRGMLRREVSDPLGFLIETPDDPAGGFGSSERAGSGAPSLGGGVGSAEYQLLLQVMQKEMEKGTKAFDRSRITSWARSMSDMAGMLATVAGRKQVVYFSEGFDSRLLFGRQPGVDQAAIDADQARIIGGTPWLTDSDDKFGNTAIQSKVADMLQAFRRADCVLHAVDIGGLRAEADIREASLGNRGQESLFYIANETGGRLIEDANDLRSRLGDVLDGSRVTYLLTFQPRPLVADGSFHRLEVRLRKGTGLQVSHREGYFAPRPFEELPAIERTLLAAEAIASPVPRRDIDLAVLAAPFRAGSAAYVPVIIEADAASLLAGKAAGGALDLEIYAYVTDSRGEIRDFFSERVQLDVSPEARQNLLASGLKYYGHLTLPPGHHLVRVLVRDARDGRSGVAAVPVEVPAYDRSEPVLLAPLFVDGERWVMVRERTTGGDGSVVYPFVVNGEPFVPAAHPVLRRGDSAQVMLVGYNLPPGELKLSAAVRTADGRPVAGGDLALVERTVTGIGGVDKLVARFTPGRLAPGEYAIEVALADGAAPPTAAPFTVVD